MKLEDYLQKYFHYSEFRNNQKELILEILNKNNIIALLPTGSGKSIIFQLAGLLLNKQTLVICPLIALMKDQVDELNRLNIKSTYIASTKTKEEIDTIYKNINEYKFIYVTPERFSNEIFKSYLNNIGLIVIDEAHTILWGKEFRHEFLNLGKNINSLSEKPVIASFSATLNKKGLLFIKKVLNLKNVKLHYELPIKNNLIYKNIYKNFLDNLMDILNKHRNQKVIIYTVTIKNMYYIYNILKDKFNVSYYCGALEKNIKENNQNDFVKDKTNIIVSTSAFGTGINIKNIRAIILYDIPLTINDYIQEAGRAGRDLNISYIYTFINKYNIKEGLKFINYSNINVDEKIKEFSYVIKYIYSKNKKKLIKKYYKL